MGIAQVFPGENAECVCQVLRNIFEHVAGAPRRIVFDSAAGVGRRVGDAFRTTEMFSAFAAHHGFAYSFCNLYSGHEKGNVEKKVGYIRDNLFVPLPQIASADAFNARLLDRVRRRGRRPRLARVPASRSGSCCLPCSVRLAAVEDSESASEASAVQVQDVRAWRDSRRAGQDRRFSRSFAGIAVHTERVREHGARRRVRASPRSLGERLRKHPGGQLLRQVRDGPLHVGSLSLLAIGSGMFVAFDSSVSVEWVAVAHAIRMIGLAFLVMPMTAYCMTGLDDSETKHATAIINAVRRVVGSLGSNLLIALIAVVTLRWAPADVAAAEGLSLLGFHVSFGLQAVIFAVLIVVVVATIGGSRGKASGASSN